MKLYRIVASDNQKAILKAQQMLGPDALIYNTRKIFNGVEVLAGITEGTSTEELTVEKNTFLKKSSSKKLENQILSKKNLAMMDEINANIQLMDENIQRLSEQIVMLREELTKKPEKRIYFYHHMYAYFLKGILKIGKMLARLKPRKKALQGLAYDKQTAN